MGEDETDISGDFAVEANGHNYLWAGVNLALGGVHVGGNR